MIGDWWNESWTPVVGCDMSLPCAQRCWARRFAHRLAHNPKTAKKYAGITDDQGRWTGEVRLDEREMERPLHWRKPRMMAVSLMGDLWHMSLRPVEIWKVYAVMCLAKQHRFVVLTKRPEHRYRWQTHPDAQQAVMDLAVDIGHGLVPKLAPRAWCWPLPNVIEMVSVSTQAELDERWPWLARTPAAMRGLHIEPLLGPVELQAGCRAWLAPDGLLPGWTRKDVRWPQIDWVVVGGETGPGARPMHPQWVRDIRDQCAAAGVPFWFKSFGAYEAICDYYGQDDELREWALDAPHVFVTLRGTIWHVGTRGTKQPHDGQPPFGTWIMQKVGRAGRLLDGREYNEVP